MFPPNCILQSESITLIIFLQQIVIEPKCFIFPSNDHFIRFLVGSHNLIEDRFILENIHFQKNLLSSWTMVSIRLHECNLLKYRLFLKQLIHHHRKTLLHNAEGSYDFTDVMKQYRFYEALVPIGVQLLQYPFGHENGMDLLRFLKLVEKSRFMRIQIG